MEAVIDQVYAVLKFVWQHQLGEDPEPWNSYARVSTLGEHLSELHKTTAAFAAWLLTKADYSKRAVNIPEEAEKVRHLIAFGSPPGARATSTAQESDAVEGFLSIAHEVSKMATWSEKQRRKQHRHRER